jgi:hypothetical protein
MKKKIFLILCMLSIQPIYSVDINNPKIQDFIDEMQKTYGINASYVSSILQDAEYQQSLGRGIGTANYL